MKCNLENDKVPREIQKVVKTKAEKIRVAEIKKESRKEARRKRKEEGENNRCEKSSGGVGNLG